MTRTSELFDLFASDPMTDVLAGGYLDRRDGLEQFNLNITSIYLQFGALYVRALADADDYRLSLEIVRSIERDFPMDEADRFGIVSLLSLLLGDSEVERRVTRFRGHTRAADPDPSEALLDCDFEFDDGQQLRLVPMVPHGLWIWNPSQRQSATPGFGEVIGVEWTRPPG